MILKKLSHVILKIFILNMIGKTILVIGGTGFIGFNFINEALKKEYIITNISLKNL